jgi:excisionase family DNA binding protein
MVQEGTADRGGVWMTAADAAKYCKVGVTTIYSAITSGALRCVRVNGRRNIRTKAVWLDEWFEQHMQRPVADGAPPKRRGREVAQAGV